MGCGFCCVADCGFCCIIDFCSDHGCSYHPQEKITVDHSKKIADELAEMKERARRDGKEISIQALENINIFMDSFVKQLKEINEVDYDGKKLNIKVNVIEGKLNKLKNEVGDFIGNRMDERLVLTDKELTIILEERNDKKRKKNFDDFYIRIHKKAISDLAKKIEGTIEEQKAFINAEVKNRLNEVQVDMNKALKDYKETKNLIKNKSTDLSVKQMEWIYEMALADILIDELNNSIRSS